MNIFIYFQATQALTNNPLKRPSFKPAQNLNSITPTSILNASPTTVAPSKTKQPTVNPNFKPLGNPLLPIGFPIVLIHKDMHALLVLYVMYKCTPQV